MVPAPDAISAGSRARVTCIRPITLTSYIARQSSASASATGLAPNAPPALLTRTSSRPPTASARAATDSAEVTSQTTGGAADLGGQVGHPVGAAGGAEDVEALGGQPAGGGGADAAAGAGDDGGAVRGACWGGVVTGPFCAVVQDTPARGPATLSGGLPTTSGEVPTCPPGRSSALPRSSAASAAGSGGRQPVRRRGGGRERALLGRDRAGPRGADRPGRGAGRPAPPWLQAPRRRSASRCWCGR